MSMRRSAGSMTRCSGRGARCLLAPCRAGLDRRAAGPPPYAEKDVAEAGLLHQPGQPLAVAGDGRGLLAGKTYGELVAWCRQHILRPEVHLAPPGGQSSPEMRRSFRENGVL